MTGYMAKFLFLHFARLSKSPLFFSWLVMSRDFFARSLRDLMHWCSLRSLLRTYQRSTCSKSSIVFTETKLRPMKKERHKYPAILTEEAWSIKDFLWPNYRGFDSQRFVLLLFSVLRVGRLPRHWFISFSRLPFPASFAWTLNVPTVHCAILSLAVAFNFLFSKHTWDETLRIEAVYLIISSTDILKTNRNLLSMRCVDKIPARPVCDQIARVTSRCL